MTYVDGYILAVPKKNKSKYIQLAEESAAVFKDHGALSVVENWADEVPDGETTSLPMAVKCEADEEVVFSRGSRCGKPSGYERSSFARLGSKINAL